MIREINIILFTICIFLGWSNSGFSKNLPKTYDAPVELSKGDQRRVQQANDKVKDATDIWDKINVTFNPDEDTNDRIDSVFSKQALPMLWKASMLMHEGNMIKYNVYHKNCADFFTKHKYEAPSGLENAKLLQKEAINYLQKSQLNRDAAENYVNEFKKAYDRFFEAFSLEIIAVKKEGRALQIYNDWPIHYDYVFDKDVEIDLFKPKPPTVAIVVKKDTTIVDTFKKVEPIAIEEVQDSTIIYYSVQIAAHTVQMSEQHIRENIYKGKMKIQEIHEDGWFKYLIGHYMEFEDAIKLLNEVNVDKAFVVAYKNGKRVPIKEVHSQ